MYNIYIFIFIKILNIYYVIINIFFKCLTVLEVREV